jgi:hypothetical protein
MLLLFPPLVGCVCVYIYIYICSMLYRRFVVLAAMAGDAFTEFYCY